MQLSLLDQAVADHGRVNEVHEEMVSVYLENDLLGLQTLSDEQLQNVDEEAGEYFLNSGINDRNLHMAESLLPELENSRVFVAVGALHLPGEHGLLNILRRNGFDLDAMDPPFREVPVTMGQ